MSPQAFQLQPDVEAEGFLCTPCPLQDPRLKLSQTSTSACTISHVLQAFQLVCQSDCEQRVMLRCSRKVQEGDWFLALKGDRFDAHEFLSEVSQKGW